MDTCNIMGNSKNIILRERSQKQKRLCNFDTFQRRFWKACCLCHDRDGQLPWIGSNGELTANVHEEMFWGDENVNLDCHPGYMLTYVKTPLTVKLKWIHFTYVNFLIRNLIKMNQWNKNHQITLSGSYKI